MGRRGARAGDRSLPSLVRSTGLRSQIRRRARIEGYGAAKGARPGRAGGRVPGAGGGPVTRGPGRRESRPANLEEESESADPERT